LGEHGKNDPQKLMGSGKDRFFEGKPILGPFLIVVSETIIELDDPDGHEPDYSPEMTVATLGNPVLPVMIAGLVYGKINPCQDNHEYALHHDDACSNPSFVLKSSTIFLPIREEYRILPK
jgi:hypothetical protein